jgi:hypothetical protein
MGDHFGRTNVQHVQHVQHQPASELMEGLGLMPRPPQCKDCIREGQTRWRPVESVGPRTWLCTTHKRARKKATSLAAHAARLVKTFGITATQYWNLFTAQDGRCYICQRANGRTKRLSVDHDHTRAVEICGHDPDMGCPTCIRVLACGPCNKDLLGRYDIPALRRAIEVLGEDPPARRFFRGESIHVE